MNERTGKEAGNEDGEDEEGANGEQLRKQLCESSGELLFHHVQKEGKGQDEDDAVCAREDLQQVVAVDEDEVSVELKLNTSFQLQGLQAKFCSCHPLPGRHEESAVITFCVAVR